jgi:hypothetical protein
LLDDDAPLGPYDLFERQLESLMSALARLISYAPPLVRFAAYRCFQAAGRLISVLFSNNLLASAHHNVSVMTQ